MDPALLTRLASAGVLERSGRRRTALRVAPRFLAHAESTAARLGRHDAEAVLHAALQEWGPYTAGSRTGAALLVRLLEDQDQMGALGPFVAAA